MIERKFDLNSIILDIVKSKASDASAYMLSNIKNNLDNFILSEWDTVCTVPNYAERTSYYHRPQYAIPYYDKEKGELRVTAHEAIRRVGLQYVDISSKTIPDESTIAFGSGYYSNDEQKAFALKYDCNIAKAPSKTQYYVLSAEEEIALHHLVKYPQGKMKPSPIKAIVATPNAIKKSLDLYIEQNKEKLNELIVNAIVYTKAMDAAQAQRRAGYGHSPCEAFLECFKYGYLGSTYKSPYSDLKFENIQGRGRVLTSPHFNFDWDWNCQLLKGLITNSKKVPDLYDVPLLYISALSDVELANVKDTMFFELPFANQLDWGVRWERKNTVNYYGNSYNISSRALSTLLPQKLEIDLADAEHYEIINTDRYITLDGHFDNLDRLFGFLSENSNITVVSEATFIAQLKASNPTLNIATYDSLYGMIQSEDENTRKTAVKMLQSFDLPESAPGIPYSGTVNRDSVDPKNYALDLAIDLVAKSNLGGASLSKWVEKKCSGSTLTGIMREYDRDRRFSNGIYNARRPGHKHNWTGFVAKDPHPAMTYDERSKYQEIMYEIGNLIPTYFEEQGKHMSKYYDLQLFKTSILNNKTFEAYKKMYVDLTENEDNLTQQEKISLGYLQLFMRHYVEYTFSRYYLGLNLNISFDLGINAPLDMPKKVDNRLMENTFGQYRKKFTEAKNKALANPIKYMDILTENEKNYRLKYIHHLSGYKSTEISDYANQAFLLGFPTNVVGSNRVDATAQTTQIISVFDYYIANL